MNRSGTRATIAVIIASWNRSADLRLALEAIFASRGGPPEVIVVDNASTDDAAAVAATFPVKLIKNRENLGFAAAIELGLRETRADYVALINNDALIAPDWCEGMAAFLDSHPDAAAVGGKQFFWDDKSPAGDRRNRYYAHTTVDARAGTTTAHLDGGDDLREVATLSGAAVMVRRAAIDDVGAPFLDPVFFAYYEETDFFSRAIRRGWKLYYRGEPACWHRVRASTAKEPYRYFYLMHRNRVIWAHRNFDDRSLARVVAHARRESRRGLFDRGDEARARRDAWAWVKKNSALLGEHRAQFYREPGLADAVAAIESRANYYGYARPEVCALVPVTARNVIDFGCAGGGLGRALKKERAGIHVRGVEPVSSQAERARTVLDAVHVGSAEDALPADWPEPDCVIFADVLEHLVDPWAAVRRARALLSRDGALVVSIPNVLHHSVAGDLMRGRFDYRDAGVLDRTHLRFFTAATARELLERGGFVIERMERVLEPPERLPGALRRWAERTPAETTEGARARLADLCTVQYLFLAR